MAKPVPDPTDLKALRRLVAQADKVLQSIPEPHPSVARSRELLSAAEKIAHHLATVSPAVALGAKGGKKTAERGPEYFARIAGLRKKRAGGRPPQPNQ
jgi:hypothetical protein